MPADLTSLCLPSLHFIGEFHDELEDPHSVLLVFILNWEALRRYSSASMLQRACI